jgi:hypothetical protein
VHFVFHQKTRNPCWRGWSTTVNLRVLTSLNHLIFKLKMLFSFVTNEGILMRRSIVLILPFQLVFLAKKLLILSQRCLISRQNVNLKTQILELFLMDPFNEHQSQIHFVLFFVLLKLFIYFSRVSKTFLLKFKLLWDKLDSGNTNWGGRLSTAHLLIEVACVL